MFFNAYPKMIRKNFNSLIGGALVVSLVMQQLVSLQDKLKCKEAELEQAREEHRQLEGEVLALRERVRLRS